MSASSTSIITTGQRLGETVLTGRLPENGVIEAFNGKLRDECLNTHQFLSFEDARSKIEAWRVNYNLNRPHSSLGQLTLRKYLRRSGIQDEEVATF